MILEDLIQGMSYIRIDGCLKTEIKSIHYDSRQINSDSLFFCIEGNNFDGHDFAIQAIEKGAIAIVIRKDIKVPEGIVKVFVEDTRIAMALISKQFYGDPTNQINLIGVTGTNGKTTITYLIKSILEQAGRKTGLIGTITNMIGDKKIPTKRTTPESLDLQRLLREMVDEGVDSVIMEVSSHSLSLSRVLGCEFDVGIFTNLTQDHLDFHGTLEEYRDAKRRLFDLCKLAVLNNDDESGRFIKDDIECKKFTYGIQRTADIYARDIEITTKGVSFQLYLPQGNSVEVNLGITGIFNVYNALAAAGACFLLDLPIRDIQSGLGNVRGVAGRFEILETETDFSVILDYAHTPDGLENVLKTVRQFAKGRIITLFGCGGNRDRLKRPIMGEVAGRYSDLCVVTSDNPRDEEPMAIINDILPGVKKTACNYVAIEDRKEAIKYALEEGKKDDIIILAGKGHESYQEFGNKTTIHFDEKEIVAEILGRDII